MTESHETNIDNNEIVFETLKSALNCPMDDPNSATYQNLRKLHAQCLLKEGKFSDAAYNFVQAIATSVRTMARFRYERALCESEKIKILEVFSERLKKPFNKSIPNTESSEENFISFLKKENEEIVDNLSDIHINSNDIKSKYLDVDHLKHTLNDSLGIEKMKKILAELPEEWTIVQLTAQYEPNEQWQPLRVVKSKVDQIYMTILKSKSLDLFNVEPFTVKIRPDPIKYGEKPLFEELYSTLQENLHVIENNARFTSHSVSKYWEKRNDCDLRMKGVISTMDKKWLAGWRCFLNGKIISADMEKSLIDYFNEIVKHNQLSLSSYQKFQLYSLLNASHYVSPSEASMLIHRIYFDDVTSSDTTLHNCRSQMIDDQCVKCDSKKITQSVKYKTYRKCFLDAVENIKNENKINGLKRAMRNPVILLIDEKLDMFPWEVLPILSKNAVTRIECLNIAYGLFKRHQDNIVNGYYLLNPKVGNFLLNPGGDLLKMEKRMSSFIDYWCPQWTGEKNKKPPPDLYENYLQQSDVFLYCGHGDGSFYIGNNAERLSDVKAVSILSGCGSVCLRYPGPRLLPMSIHSHIHIANGPLVIGMLWEVTDYEVDKVTSMLLSLFVPSKAPKSWGNLKKSKWNHGIIDIEDCEDSDKFEPQFDLLLALSKAKKSSSFIMIASSVVSRGLPVRIIPDV